MSVVNNTVSIESETSFVQHDWDHVKAFLSLVQDIIPTHLATTNRTNGLNSFSATWHKNIPFAYVFEFPLKGIELRLMLDENLGLNTFSVRMNVRDTTDTGRFLATTSVIHTPNFDTEFQTVKNSVIIRMQDLMSAFMYAFMPRELEEVSSLYIESDSSFNEDDLNFEDFLDDESVIDNEDLHHAPAQ